MIASFSAFFLSWLAYRIENFEDCCKGIFSRAICFSWCSTISSYQGIVESFEDRHSIASGPKLFYRRCPTRCDHQLYTK